MATGIRINNDSGTTQIDETYFNLVLIDKFTATISTPVTTAYDYTVSGDIVAIAVKVYPETFTVTTCSVSGSTWTFRLSFYNNPLTTGTCTFTVYAFARPPTPTETVGLKVLNASGAVIFHSQFKPLRVVATVGGTSGYTGPSGRDLAALVLGMPMYGFAVPGGTSVYDTYSLRVNGNVIEALRVTVAFGAVVGFARDGSYAAIDVTNY